MTPAERLLLSDQELARALGPQVQAVVDDAGAPAPAMGDVLRAVAVDSAYRRYRVRVVVEEAERPATASMLTLLFDSWATAQRTFSQVAQAAHLSTQLDDVQVAVETVTAASGLVSYWGFLHTDAVIAILTLDTVDPKDVSIADLRALLTAAVQRLQREQGDGDGVSGGPR